MCSLPNPLHAPATQTGHAQHRWTHERFSRAPRGVRDLNHRIERSRLDEHQSISGSSIRTSATGEFVQVSADVKNQMKDSKPNNGASKLFNARWTKLTQQPTETDKSDPMSKGDIIDQEEQHRQQQQQHQHNNSLSDKKMLQPVMRSTSKDKPPASVYSTLEKLPFDSELANSKRPQQSEAINRLYFDAETPRKVQAHAGETAYLSCKLRSIQKRDNLRVSWARDLQILTSDEFRYTGDERFNSVYRANSLDWMLAISNVSESDEGPYECQVNSEPKPAILTIYLEIIKARIEILEGPKVDLDEGDDIKLTCRVEFAPNNPMDDNGGDSRSTIDDDDDDDSSNSSMNNRHPLNADDDSTTTTFGPNSRQSPTSIVANNNNNNNNSPVVLSYKYYIYWYKSNVSLEYSNPRGGIKVQHRNWSNEANSTKLIESSLTVSEAKRSDSGVYICKIFPQLSGVLPAQTRVSIGGAPSELSNPGNSLTQTLASNGIEPSQAGNGLHHIKPILLVLMMLNLFTMFRIHDNCCNHVTNICN